MTIKADGWIKRMCRAPDGFIALGGAAVNVSKETNGRWVIRENGYPVFGAQEVREFSEAEKAHWMEVEGPMISPFVDKQVRYATDPHPSSTGEDDKPRKLVSWGCSSYGYDVRCADEWKIFTNVNSTVIDPKNFDEKSFVDFKGDVCIIPPNSFALARTVERFKIPRNVLTVCLGKSTYARCGIIVGVTPLEPEWEGFLTLEFSNTTPLPAMLYSGEGCAQLLFFQSDEQCEVSYKDRNGKYMNQGASPVSPKV